MLTREFAEHFAADWIASWNSHDLDRILEHYTSELEFSSPFVVVVTGELLGKLKGKNAVRDYWSKGLARIPNLKFELIGLFLGASTLVIHYRRQDASFAAECFEFDAKGDVFRSAAHYAA